MAQIVRHLCRFVNLIWPTPMLSFGPPMIQQRRLHLLGKPLLTLPGPENSALLALGAVAVDPACPPAL